MAANNFTLDPSKHQLDSISTKKDAEEEN